MKSRKKNITGESEDISRRGRGLGSGPVGRTEKQKQRTKKVLKFVVEQLVKKASSGR